MTIGALGAAVSPRARRPARRCGKRCRLAFSLRRRERKASMTHSRLRGELPRSPLFFRIPAIVFGLALPALVASGLLGGCPREGPICAEGFDKCGLACADLSSDPLNCGGCGVTCSIGELCQENRCQCRPGTSLCGNACVSTETDPRHCGGCTGLDGGAACAPEQVCELGQCRAECLNPRSTRCGQSCVDLRSDVNNCGQCGRRCGNAQSCHQGICTYD